METKTIQKTLLSTKETAQTLGVSERTLWSITAPRGELACCRIGSRVCYSPQAIEKYITDREAECFSQ